MHESNRNRSQDRRPWTGGHPQRDQTDHAHPGGGPAVDLIDTVGPRGLLHRKALRADEEDIVLGKAVRYYVKYIGKTVEMW